MRHGGQEALVGRACDRQVDNLVAKIEVSDGTATWQPVPSWLAYFFDLGERVALS